MSSPRAVLVALVALTLAACSAGPASQPTATAQVTLPPVTAAPATTPEPEPSTEPPTLAPTPTPTPKLTATPKPVPPKPSGLELNGACGYVGGAGGCDMGGDGTSRLTWKAPRTKGVEIRVYGVTTCFRTDAAEGPCLREHTTLPDDIGVQLAKGPASKGGLSFFFTLHYGAFDEGCTYGYLSANGTPFSSIVVAAYNASGHSIFAIVEPGRYEAGECGVETD